MLLCHLHDSLTGLLGGLVVCWWRLIFTMASTSTLRSRIYTATRVFAVRVLQRTQTTLNSAFPDCAAKARVAMQIQLRGVEVLTTIVKEARWQQ